MEKIIYEYDLDKVFINETVEKISPLDGSRIVPQFYTHIKPVFNGNTHFAIFDESTQSWNYKEFTPIGVFYHKQTMDKVQVRSQFDTQYSADLYTHIAPLQEYDDGTIQAFNEELQAWEYTQKGATLLEKELKEELERAKKEFLAQLENDFNASKLIVIQNGETIVIKHDTKERTKFMENIDNVTNEYNNNRGAVMYWQNDIENRCSYIITLSTYIWKYIFSDLFSMTKPSGFTVSIRKHNELNYQLVKAKISNAGTLEELMQIFYSFINPNGLVIDISVKAKEIFDNPNTPESIKAEIVKMTTEDGIHLIKKVLW